MVDRDANEGARVDARELFCTRGHPSQYRALATRRSWEPPAVSWTDLSLLLASAFLSVLSLAVLIVVVSVVSSCARLAEPAEKLAGLCADRVHA